MKHKLPRRRKRKTHLSHNRAVRIEGVDWIASIRMKVLAKIIKPAISIFTNHLKLLLYGDHPLLHFVNLLLPIDFQKNKGLLKASKNKSPHHLFLLNYLPLSAISPAHLEWESSNLFHPPNLKETMRILHHGTTD